MPEQIDIDEVLRNNCIDPKVLERSRKLRQILRESGLRGAVYDLASPIDRHRALVGDTGSLDQRPAHLNDLSDDQCRR